MDFKIPDTPEELFRQGQKHVNNFKFNNYIPAFLLLGILLAVVLSSFYTVEANEVGVIRRFGKYTRTTSPGLHWKLPDFGIFYLERLSKVKVEKNYKEEFGFRTIKGGVKTQYSSRSYVDESLMLTGDLNVMDVRWVVQFKINDPVKLLFNIRDPRETVRDMSESAMQQVVGDSSFSEVLNTRRVEISREMHDKLQEILDEYNSGIKIETVELKDVNVPKEVKASFNEVNQAEQEKEKVRNQARKAYYKVIPKAKGEAEKTIREAEGYALQRVNRAKGDADKFIQTWKAYREAKDVTRRRLYLETMSEVLAGVGKVYISEPKSNNILPLLNLSEVSK